MEPSLREDDVVLVRKSDAGMLLSRFGIAFLRADDDEILRTQLRRAENDEAATAGYHVAVPRLYEQPPMALPGHVVVYKNPETVCEYCTKRVVGVSGQVLRTGSRLQSVPVFSLHVEGDNSVNSRDSRHYGAISKNLLVGIAEYVVWPPTRWQRILIQQDVGGKTRAFWP
jgi:hypothetical protein